MRNCIHSRTEVLFGVEPSPVQNCAECEKYEREIKLKDREAYAESLRTIASLRAENERLRDVVDQASDVLEMWVQHMSEQEKKITDLKAAISSSPAARSINKKED